MITPAVSLVARPGILALKEFTHSRAAPLLPEESANAGESHPTESANQKSPRKTGLYSKALCDLQSLP